MKSKIVSLLLCLLAFGGAQAQFVTIPDANFVAFLQTNFPTCMTGNQMDISCAGITGATTLGPSYLNIADFTGLQYFTSVTNLNIAGNHVTNLPAFPPSMVSVNAIACQIATLPPIPGTAQNLYLSGNAFTTVPTLPAGLLVLEMDGSQLASFPALPASLEELSVQSCNLSALPSLPPGLRSLACNNNNFTALPSLPATLQTLGAGGCPLAALPTLPNGLRFLTLDYDTGLPLPATLPDSLRDLYCTNMQLGTIQSLPSKLNRLDCNDNNLTALPALPATLRYLNVFRNQITALPALPAGLELIQAYYNDLVTVNNLPASLNTADFRWNQITCFGPFPVSTTLNVSFDGNPVSCIPNYAAFMTPQIGSVPICTPNNPMGCVSGEGIGGMVFDDLNGDCLRNGIDPGLPQVPVKIYDNFGTFVQGGNTAAGGSYFYTLPLGTWTAKIDTAGKPYRVTCAQPGTDSTVTLSLGNALDLGVDFEIECKPGFDIGVLGVVVDNIIFPGQSFNATFRAGDLSQHYGLHCATGVAGQVVVTTSGPITYTGVVPGCLVPTIAGNTYTYAIADFGLLDIHHDLGLRFMTDTSAQTSDIVCFDLVVSPTSGDYNPANNTRNACFQATNSFDPNAKDVYPSVVEAGYDDWLNYTVHFQNIGTAAAFNIRVADTLDGNLDWATTEMLAASHYETWRLMGNALDVTFPNIMLPDSASNPAGSQGWFMYRVRPKANLPFGTIIPNNAAIYFDFNPAIVTNTAITSYNLATSVMDQADAGTIVSVYPNPSAAVFHVEFPATWKKADWTVTNLMGQELSRGSAVGGDFGIDLGAEAAGFYLLRVGDGREWVVRELVKR